MQIAKRFTIPKRGDLRCGPGSTFPTPLRAGDFVELIGEEFHHAIRVHRSHVDEQVELFDGCGAAWLARIESIGKSSASLRVFEPAAAREPRTGIRLALALIQPDRFELVLQKGTELGVGRFVPLITRRSEVKPERIRGKQQRWEKIILEAVKQCGRATLPAIESPAELSSVLRHDGTRVMFDAEADATPLPEKIDEVTVLVGPEGGWSSAELEQARAAGCAFQRLGPRRLRAETAAMLR